MPLLRNTGRSLMFHIDEILNKVMSVMRIKEKSVVPKTVLPAVTTSKKINGINSFSIYVVFHA